MGLGDLSLLERAFAEAALDPTQWVRALEVATMVTGSYGATLLPQTGTAIPNIPFTDSIADVSAHYFRDGWHQRDERNAGFHLLMKRGAVDDTDCTDLERIGRHPYYQEFLAPHGLRWFAGVRVACGDEVWCLSLQRTIDQGLLPPDDKRQLATLSEKLSTSAALARALATATLDGALEAFELSDIAVALVNRQGEVYRLNRTAETVLSGDVRVVGRKLVSIQAASTAALDRALKELMWRQTGPGIAAPVALARSGGRPLLAYPARLSAVAANALADCQAVLVLVDPDARTAASQSVLRSCFGLSAAEARLASQLSIGHTLDQASAALGVSKETSRNQLKSVFAKIGIGRQSELIAVLGNLLSAKPPTD